VTSIRSMKIMSSNYLLYAKQFLIKLLKFGFFISPAQKLGFTNPGVCLCHFPALFVAQRNASKILVQCDCFVKFSLHQKQRKCFYHRVGKLVYNLYTLGHNDT
jgi:hypothetical protein